MNKNDIVYIACNDRRPYGLAIPRDDVELLQALRARSRGDMGPFLAMKREGRLRLLEHMARAEVLAVGPRGVIVEVLDGNDRGDFVWVPMRYIVEADDRRLGWAAAYTGPDELPERARGGTSEPLPPPRKWSRSELLAQMRRER